MALHWPVIGWMYGSRTCLLHALIRTALVTVIWLFLPAHRLTLLPFAVALVYAVTVVGLLREVGQAARMMGEVDELEEVESSEVRA